MFPVQAFPDPSFSSTFFPTGTQSDPGFLSPNALPFNADAFHEDGFLSPLVLPFAADLVEFSNIGFQSANVLPFGAIEPGEPPEPPEPPDLIGGGYSPRELKLPSPWDREDEQTDALDLKDLRDITDILEILNLWLH